MLSLLACPSPLICFSLFYLKAPPSIRSCRCVCRPVTSRCSLVPSVDLFQQRQCFIVSQKGTVYLLNYEVLDGVPGNVINGKQSYLTAPLCLLHLNQQGQLVPIAIQVSSRGLVISDSLCHYYPSIAANNTPAGPRTVQRSLDLWWRWRLGWSNSYVRKPELRWIRFL